MKTVSFDAIVAGVRELCIKAACDLPEDVYNALKVAQKNESSPHGKVILTQCIDNADIASHERKPLCQDTGTGVFFASMGNGCTLTGGSLKDAINEGCRQGYRDGFLRKSIVSDPLFNRKNTGDNTPAMIHFECVEGDELKITHLPKGGGCENMSALAMLKPADGKDGVVDFIVRTVKESGGNPCPPVVVGVGIGGTADKASIIAKKALLRRIGSRHPEKQYALLEQELLKKINALGNGPQGLGGNTTALAVHIETFPCHIASMPVAVNLNCHAARQASIVL